MADEFDQAEYDRLQGEKGANLDQQDECQALIDSLNGKINDLRTAYNKLDEAKESLQDAASALKKIPSKQFHGWKGSVADFITTCCKEDTALYGYYNTYINKIDEIEDSINWQIYDLQCQVNEQEGILGDLKNAFNWICTSIRNLFN